MSRRTLDLIDLGNDLDEVSDQRPAELDQLTIVPGEVLDIIREVFAGIRTPGDEGLVDAVLEARRAIGQAWGQAGRAAVEIGRALNALDARLVGKEERARLKLSFHRLFPFSDPVGSQFRRVAHAVDSGRFTISDLPGSYSAAYQLALLDSDELDEARKRGLVAPHVSRAAVLAFRRERANRTSVDVDIAALLAERRRIREQRRQLIAQLQALKQRDNEIRARLESQHT